MSTSFHRALAKRRIFHENDLATPAPRSAFECRRYESHWRERHKHYDKQLRCPQAEPFSSPYNQLVSKNVSLPADRKEVIVPSLAERLTRTDTAQWYRAARAVQWSAAWDERQRCFAVLHNILAVNGRSGADDASRAHEEISPPSLSDIARHANMAPATIYKWWGTTQGPHTVPRWAGSDARVKPNTAFIAEAKIVSFWYYRLGYIRVLDEFELSPFEAAAAYYRVLAAWAHDHPALAACGPVDPPRCTSEDLAVFARRADGASARESAATTSRLTSLAHDMTRSVLADASMTPLGAFNTIRDYVVALFAPPRDPIASRVDEVLAELADRLLHRAEDDAVISPGQAQQIQTALTALSSLLTVGAGNRIPDQP